MRSPYKASSVRLLYPILWYSIRIQIFVLLRGSLTAHAGSSEGFENPPITRNSHKTFGSCTYPQPAPRNIKSECKPEWDFASGHIGFERTSRHAGANQGRRLSSRVPATRPPHPAQRKMRRDNITPPQLQLHIIMSNSSPLKDAADAAEAELKPLVGVTASSKYPYLHLPRLLPKCAALRDRWLEVRPL